MERIFKFINQTLYFVSMVLLLLEVVIVAGVAFCRYILHYTPAWGESLALLLGVWFCFLAAAYAIPSDVHLKMTLIDNMVSEKYVLVLEWFGLAMTMLLGICFTVYGYSLLGIAEQNIMSGLGMPSTVLYAAVPISGIFFIIESIDRGRSLLCQHN